MTPRRRTDVTEPTTVILQNDAPIPGARADAFDRKRIARRMALEAQLAPPDSGFVVALSGPWGSGKTSISRLVAEIVRENPDNHVVLFNPWMFSSGDDLVARFLAELAAVLGTRHEFHNLARKVANYAASVSGLAAFIPVVGGQAAATLAAAQKVMAAAGAGQTLETQRAELAAALTQVSGRIVVLIDDIDRLTDQEIHDVVRLVKLVGELPRVSYVLCFDADRVAEVLGRDAHDAAQAIRRGHDYLEKIVQSQHQVPPLRPVVLIRYLLDHVTAALAPHQVVTMNTADWDNIVGLGVRALLNTPRDAKRIANAMPAARELFGDEIALVDLFGLECLRVLEPEIYASLPEIADVLVNEGVFLGLNKDHDTATHECFERVLATARHPSAVRTLLGQLFPAARPLGQATRAHADWQRERRDKRVSRGEVFRTYLYAALGADQLPAATLEGLAQLTADPPRLAEALAAIPNLQLLDALGRMDDYSADFSGEHAAETAGVLLDLYGKAQRRPGRAHRHAVGRNGAPMDHRRRDPSRRGPVGPGGRRPRAPRQQGGPHQPPGDPRMVRDDTRRRG